MPKSSPAYRVVDVPRLQLKHGSACVRWNAWLFPWASCDVRHHATPYTHLHVCFTSTSLEHVRTYTHGSVHGRPSGKTLDTLSACAQVSFAPLVTGDFSWTTAHLFTHVGQDARKEGKILRHNQRSQSWGAFQHPVRGQTLLPKEETGRKIKIWFY